MYKDMADVLVVDDNPNEVALLKRIIKKIMPLERVVFFDDGESAVNFLLTKAASPLSSDGYLPRLVILDVKLPGTTGIELLGRLRAYHELGCLPVVMFTSSNESKDVKAAYDNRANSFVVKPVDYSELNTVVVAIIGYWLNINIPPVYSISTNGVLNEQPLM